MTRSQADRKMGWPILSHKNCLEQCHSIGLATSHENPPSRKHVTRKTLEATHGGTKQTDSTAH